MNTHHKRFTTHTTGLVLALTVSTLSTTLSAHAAIETDTPADTAAVVDDVAPAAGSSEPSAAAATGVGAFVGLVGIAALIGGIAGTASRFMGLVPSQ